MDCTGLTVKVFGIFKPCKCSFDVCVGFGECQLIFNGLFWCEGGTLKGGVNMANGFIKLAFRWVAVMLDIFFSKLPQG